jgi:hypothetical protein
MTLAIDTAVRGVADVLRDRVASTLTDSYAIEAVRLAGIMLTIMANAADDAVALRVAENAQMRALFSEALAVVTGTALSSQLEKAAGSTDPGLRISELDYETDRLRRLLVALQIQLETQADSAAAALNQRIWRLLQEVEKSRAPRT